MANAYKILEHNDVLKVRNGAPRLQNLISMIETGAFFATTKGAVKLNKQQHIKSSPKPLTLNELKTLMQEKGFSATFVGKDPNNNTILVEYPKQFYKNEAFGGKGIGSGTAAEDRYLGMFKNELSKVLEKESNAFINLNIGGRIVRCAGIISTPTAGGFPKADFTVVDVTGKHVAWISHKAGTKATDFQQYGGLSDSVFNNHPEVKKFMNDVVKVVPNGLKTGEAYMRKVKDPALIQKSVFGINAGSSTRGIHNVDEFHQGEMKLVKRGNVYTIESVHKGLNGKPLVGAGYQPIFYARYTSDRGANVAGVSLKYARVGIFPTDKAGKTTNTI